MALLGSTSGGCGTASYPFPVTASPASTGEVLVQKMFDGGYVVTKGNRGVGQYTEPTFACSTLDEALKYIKGKLEPKPAK